MWQLAPFVGLSVEWLVCQPIGLITIRRLITAWSRYATVNTFPVTRMCPIRRILMAQWTVTISWHCGRYPNLKLNMPFFSLCWRIVKGESHLFFVWHKMSKLLLITVGSTGPTTDKNIRLFHAVYLSFTFWCSYYIHCAQNWNGPMDWCIESSSSWSEWKHHLRGLGNGLHE